VPGLVSRGASDLGGAWELCNSAWRGIVDQHGDAARATDFAAHERVVVLVWTVMGIVDNGGFEYLFSSELPGDPGYRLSLAALRTIRCHGAADALEDALRVFPGGQAPLDDATRKAMFDAHPEEERRRLASRFWQAHDAIVMKLAAYIGAQLPGARGGPTTE
jgi:hypothetical protein